jgi:hypothetical protein
MLARRSGSVITVALIAVLLTTGALAASGCGEEVGFSERAALAAPGGADRPGSREAIRSGIRAGLPQIRACYERSLQGQPGLRGKLEVAFRIEASGRVGADLTATGLDDAPAFRECVLGEVAQLTFAPPEGSIKVRYPFTFEPGARE